MQNYIPSQEENTPNYETDTAAKLPAAGLDVSKKALPLLTSLVPGSPLARILLAGLGGAAVNGVSQVANDPYRDVNTDNMTNDGLINGGSQALGEGLFKALGEFLPKQMGNPKIPESFNDVFDPEVQLHGSNVEIPNPLPKASTGSFGNSVFFTTPDSYIADMMGTRAVTNSVVENPEILKDGWPKVSISQYFQKKVPTLNMKEGFDEVGFNDLGKKLGLNEQEISDAMENMSGNYYKNIPSKTIQGQKIDPARSWDSLLMQVSGKSLNPDVTEVGNEMIGKLKDAGYSRISKYMDPLSNAVENIHFDPENDLVHVDNPKIQELKDAISKNNLIKKQPTDASSMLLKMLPSASAQEER